MKRRRFMNIELAIEYEVFEDEGIRFFWKLCN